MTAKSRPGDRRASHATSAAPLEPGRPPRASRAPRAGRRASASSAVGVRSRASRSVERVTPSACGGSPARLQGARAPTPSRGAVRAGGRAPRQRRRPPAPARAEPPARRARARESGPRPRAPGRTRADRGSRRSPRWCRHPSGGSRRPGRAAATTPRPRRASACAAIVTSVAASGSGTGDPGAPSSIAASPRTTRLASASTSGTNPADIGSAVHVGSKRLPTSTTVPARTIHGSPATVASMPRGAPPVYTRRNRRLTRIAPTSGPLSVTWSSVTGPPNRHGIAPPLQPPIQRAQRRHVGRGEDDRRSVGQRADRDLAAIPQSPALPQRCGSRVQVSVARVPRGPRHGRHPDHGLTDVIGTKLVGIELRGHRPPPRRGRVKRRVERNPGDREPRPREDDFPIGGPSGPRPLNPRQQRPRPAPPPETRAAPRDRGGPPRD